MPEPEPLWQSAEHIAASNRGLQYGDGLFETILVRNRRLWLEDLHWQRLQMGAGRLSMHIAQENVDLLVAAALQQAPGEDWCVLKLIATRVASGRGYGYEDTSTDLHVSLWPVVAWQDEPVSITAGVAATRLATQPRLAGIKHLNRLEQVLARAEAPMTRYPELLMRDVQDNLVEAVASNLFVVIDGNLCTPSLHHCGVAGVARSRLMQVLPVQVRTMTLADLAQADEAFLTNSVRGVTRITRVDVDGRPLRFAGSRAALAAHSLFWSDLC